MPYLAGDSVGIIVTQRFPSYKDQPGVLYHYPKAPYDDRVRALLGKLVLAYEPRRGGTSRDSAMGGRMAFVGTAFLGSTYDDPDDPTHAFVELRGYFELPRPVPLGETAVSGRSLQSAVREIRRDVAEDILRMGLADLALASSAAVREGLVDVSLPIGQLDRPVREVISNRLVRDASFRLRVVEQVYRGRCALTGIKMTNGNGRAEADAAHIRPVANGGPDYVRNGLALTKTVHWAFDRGLISLADDGRILAVESALDDPLRKLIAIGGQAILPSDPLDRPHPSFLQWHRQNVFKGVA